MIAQKPGSDRIALKTDIRQCGLRIDRSGRDALAFDYVAGAVLFGVLGLVVTTVEADKIRDRGVQTELTKCLKQKGYSPRKLTDAEIGRINAAPTQQARHQILDEIISSPAF